MHTHILLVSQLEEPSQTQLAWQMQPAQTCVTRQRYGRCEGHSRPVTRAVSRSSATLGLLLIGLSEIQFHVEDSHFGPRGTSQASHMPQLAGHALPLVHMGLTCHPLGQPHLTAPRRGYPLNPRYRI